MRSVGSWKIEDPRPIVVCLTCREDISDRFANTSFQVHRSYGHVPTSHLELVAHHSAPPGGALTRLAVSGHLVRLSGEQFYISTS